MYVYLIKNNKDDVLGSVKIPETSGILLFTSFELLVNKYKNDVIGMDEDFDIDDFVDWLNENHDEDAERFFFDGEIIL